MSAALEFFCDITSGEFCVILIPIIRLKEHSSEAHVAGERILSFSILPMTSVIVLRYA
jgi:hypothetical protein